MSAGDGIPRLENASSRLAGPARIQPEPMDEDERRTEGLAAAQCFTLLLRLSR
jgi:hypothetical protein